ncbi:IMPACT family member YigZ [Bifidobacterium anseris]|uniref:IMPACT family member YigZ n=1 Tax=Bifidobacterium anseris TaxID=2020963 RepID=A0A2N5IYA2_9BIFI|nr:MULTISPECIES: YigZ family protein [Bifidobacterium]PLS26943.1 IMPACT family member YigZ [Bifidobacterium anseris]
MTRTILNDAAAPAHDAFVEKKSEFIGDACHVDDLDDALMFVEQIRDMHPKSRHVAYAAIVTDDTGRVMERMSDDGEPSGTAGKPILDVLRANGLTDCVVAVTRYFGGILLGSGGLIRAYSTGASLAVKAARTACIVQCRRYLVRLDYAQLGAFQQLLSACDGAQLDAAFTDHVEVECAVPTDIEGQFTDRVRETFNANVVPEALGLVARPVEER